MFRTDALGSSMRSVPVSADYEGSVGKFMSVVAGLDGSQPGDPRRLGEALVTLAEVEDPPLRAPIDPGASGSVRGRLVQQLAELDEWGPRLATTPIG